MLVHMRKAAGTWVMAIFSFLIIISFAIFGIGDIFRGRTTNAVATVGDVEITDTALSREFQREMNQFQAVFRGGLDVDRARELGLVDRALDTLVARSLYDLEAARLGVAISDDLVVQTIKADSNFQNASGEFDQNIFASTLATNGMTEEFYVALLRGNLARAQLVGSVTAAAAAPSFLVDAIYRVREQRRKVEYFVVADESITDIPEPEESALAAFHQENASLFTAPEYRKLAFIHVTPEDLVDEITVTDEAIESEYDDRRDSFVQPERRTVDQILLTDEAAANSAYNRLMQGGDFIAVATEATGVGAEDISLGSITRDAIFAEVADAVFDLAEGEVGRPVESPFGWHIFRVTEIQPEGARPLAEVRNELARDIALREAVDALYRLTNTIDDTLAGGATLEQVADQLKLRSGSIEAVSANGETPGGSMAQGLPGAPDFLRTAFATPEGEESTLTESNDGSFFVLRVDAVIPPALRSLETVRSKVAEAWRATERRKVAEERAKMLVDRVNAGEDFSALATEQGQSPTKSNPIRRDGDGADPAFTLTLVDALFALDVGAAATSRTNDNTSYIVLRLVETVEAEAADDEAGASALRDGLVGAIANDLTAQYRQSLAKRFPVRVNQGAVNALF